jgi:hypothetical protein
VNPKAETVEELQGRRKGLHLGMIKLAREDLALCLQAGIDAHTVSQSALPPPTALFPCASTYATALSPSSSTYKYSRLDGA